MHLVCNAPPSFWDKFCATAAYLTNFTPTPSLNHKTAYEAWFSRQPSLSHLCEIGCWAFALILSPTSPVPPWVQWSNELVREMYIKCYRLSKRPNCFRGTCSGLGTWRPRCTRGASSGTRHVVRTPFLSLIALVTVLMNGVASPTGPASYTTRASVRAPVPFPQLSPHILSYRPIIPSPCALGQQVITLLSRLIVLPHLVY